MPKHEVRGPDPDGDWFVVLVDGDDETAIDETFDSEADARAMVAELMAAFQRGNSDAGIEGAESQTVYNPYDQDDEPALYDAWDLGFDVRTGL